MLWARIFHLWWLNFRISTPTAQVERGVECQAIPFVLVCSHKSLSGMIENISHFLEDHPCVSIEHSVDLFTNTIVAQEDYSRSIGTVADEKKVTLLFAKLRNMKHPPSQYLRRIRFIVLKRDPVYIGELSFSIYFLRSKCPLPSP